MCFVVVNIGNIHFQLKPTHDLDLETVSPCFCELLHNKNDILGLFFRKLHKNQFFAIKYEGNVA